MIGVTDLCQLDLACPGLSSHEQHVDIARLGPQLFGEPRQEPGLQRRTETVGRQLRRDGIQVDVRSYDRVRSERDHGVRQPWGRSDDLDATVRGRVDAPRSCLQLLGQRHQPASPSTDP